MGKRGKIQAEAFDVMQYFYSTVHEPLIHCMISLAGHVNETIFKKAVDLSFGAIPLLRYCFDTTGRHPYWVEQDFTAQDMVNVVAADSDPEEQRQRLLATTIDPACEPQLKIYILREQDNDTLCMIINHMICDGAGFKEYLYLLCDLYTRCTNQTTIEPKLQAAPRDARLLTADFSFMEKLRNWFSPNDTATPYQQLTFPLQGDPKRPLFVTEQILTKDFLAIKGAAQSLNVTVNDMILAAYIRVLAKKLGTDHIRIPCPVDLRKYIPAGRKFGITNLTSNFICDITIPRDEAFEETVAKVNIQMKRQKAGTGWLKGIMMLEFFYHSLPFRICQKLFHHTFTIPVISFTNLGIIDQNLLHFGTLQIKDAYLTGAVKYVPYFQIAVSTYDNCCTLSSNLYGTPDDKEIVKGFLTQVKEELLNLSGDEIGLS